MTWLLALVCFTPLALVPFYLFFLALSPFVGMNLGEVTVFFLNESLVALDPLFAIGIGSWLMFSYFYSIAVPPAQEIERGRMCALLGSHAFSLGQTAVWLIVRLFAVGQVLAPLNIGVPRRSVVCSLPEIKSLLRLRAYRESLKHLATGWSPGTHPRVVYH